MNVLRHRITASLGAFALAAVLCGAPASARAQDAAVEMAEAKAALQASVSKSVQQGIELSELRTVNANLLEGMAASNAEAERYRGLYEELRLQMEALGVEAIKDGSRGVSEKLMKAVSDFRLIQEEKAALTDRLVRLSEAVLAYMQSAVSSNVESRMAVEAALRGADEALGLGEGKPQPREVRPADQGGRIVSVKRDLGVFVIDLGAKSGVRIGTPFRIIRKDRPIGSAYVVDVRDHISGATISELSATDDSIEVGDEVRLDPQANF